MVEPRAQDPDSEAVLDTRKFWELEVKDFEKAQDLWGMKAEEKLAEADRLKALGTDFYKQGLTRKAMRCYGRAVKYVESEGSDLSDEQKARRKELYTALSLNVALCCNKAGQYRDAIKHCDNVLKADVDSFKALSRRGLAYAGLNELEAARKDLAVC